MFVVKRQFSTFRETFIFNGTCVTAVNMVFTTLKQLKYIPRHFFQCLTNILSIYILYGTHKYFVFYISNSYFSSFSWRYHGCCFLWGQKHMKKLSIDLYIEAIIDHKNTPKYLAFHVSIFHTYISQLCILELFSK